jgi:hypothetical protein
MTDKQFVHVSGSLTLLKFLLAHTWDSMTRRQSDEALDGLRQMLEMRLKTMNVPEDVEPDEEALAIQREALRQLDEFWQQLLDARKTGAE